MQEVKNQNDISQVFLKVREKTVVSSKYKHSRLLQVTKKIVHSPLDVHWVIKEFFGIKVGLIVLH